MSEHTPTQLAHRAELEAGHARTRIRTAWQLNTITATTSSSNSRTGRVHVSTTPDPAAATVASHDRTLTRILDQLTEVTRELGHATHTDTDEIDRHVDWVRHRIRRRHHRLPHGNHQRPQDPRKLLDLHHRWHQQAAQRIRSLDTDPARWDDAKSLAQSLNAHTAALTRLAHWTWATLIQPDAPPGTRVCNDPHCQRALQPDDANLCKGCANRAAIRTELAEQRRAREAAARAAEARQQPPAPDWPQPVDPADGWPLCSSDHRPCGRRLPQADAAAGQRNCGACRAHATRHPDQVATHRRHMLADRIPPV